METAPHTFSTGSGEALQATVAAELHVQLATVRVVRFAVSADEISFPQRSEGEAHRLDLSLTPRPSRGTARYAERWARGRYERLGEVICIPAGETITLDGTATAGPLTSINCLLHTEPIRNLFEEDLTFTDRQLDATLDIRSGSIRSLLLRLGDETRRPGFASEILAELIAGQLVVELFRYPGDAPATAIGGLAPWRLRLIEERLMDLRAAPTLAELAEICGLSVRQLTRGFRASRGCSIGEYVAQHQIDRAKRRLVTDESIKSIAYTSGFRSLGSFSTAFRRATGQSPREYRQQLHSLQRSFSVG